ncbi:hypothetical protein Ciccas_012360, partial [Cichlidogyrus casuarinus]
TIDSRPSIGPACVACQSPPHLFLVGPRNSEIFSGRARAPRLFPWLRPYPKFHIYYKLSSTFQAEYVKPTIHHGNLFHPVNIAEYEVTDREFDLNVLTTVNTSIVSEFIGRKVDLFITVELAFTNSSRNKAIRAYRTREFSLSKYSREERQQPIWY